MGRGLIKVEGRRLGNEERDGVGTMGLAGVCGSMNSKPSKGMDDQIRES